MAVGSRGDAEPFCALAAQLSSSSTVVQVDLFLQTDLLHLAPKSNEDKIKVHALPFTAQDFYQIAGTAQKGADDPNPRVKFVGVVSEIVGQLVLPCVHQVRDVCCCATTAGEDGDDEVDVDVVDAMVCSSLARPLCLVVARHINIPLYIVHLQSLAPTPTFPHYSTKGCVQVILSNEEDPEMMDDSGVNGDVAHSYRQTYVDLERVQYDFLKEYMHETMPSDFRASIPTADDVIEAVAGESSEPIFAVNAFTATLFPENTVYGPKVFETGALADRYIPSGWTPPTELQSFLQKHPKPVCVGYGSMPFAQVATILEALEACQQPAVLVGSCMVDFSVEDKSKWAPNNAFCIASVPYPWLLPQCSMMLCHGGVGVVQAALRAGIPPVVSPLLGDQFFFAALLPAKGLGVQASGTLASVTVEGLVNSIQTEAPACFEACRALKEQMDASEPNGASALAEIILSDSTGQDR